MAIDVPSLPPFTGPDPDWHPSTYWEELAERGLIEPREHVHAPQVDDFSTLIPHADPGERPADAVMVPGAIVRPPVQARSHLNEAELDRRRAYEVIAMAAVAYIDSHSADRAATYEAMCDAIAENKDVIA